MSAASLVARGQWRIQGRRQLALAASFAAGLLAFFLIAMLLQGAQDGAVRPLRDLLTADARITWGNSEVAGGMPIDDHREVASRLRTLEGVVVAPRWEASQVTVRRDEPGNWTGGLLVGLDPGITPEGEAIGPYLLWGSFLPTTSLADPATGRVYVPLVVGEAAARRLNLTRNDDGSPDFSQVLVVTSGRFAHANDMRPLSVEAVVVGIFATGIDSLDRFTAFVPIEEARRLVGDRPGDPTANAILVYGHGPRQVDALGIEGAQAQDATSFANGVMGSFLLLLRVAGGLAVALVLVLLGVWLVHEVGTMVLRDRPVVAALRAIGIPFATILRGYVFLVAATIGAAWLAAALAALLVTALAPPLWFSAHSLHIHIPWRLHAWPLLWSLAAASTLAFLGTWSAARRLATVDVAEALRP